MTASTVDRDCELEAALLGREPGLPGLAAVLGAGGLDQLVAALPATDAGPTRVRYLRLKAGTSVMAALEVHGATGPRPWLLTSYAPGDAGKAARDAAYAHRSGLPAVHDALRRTTLAPAAADRALRPHGRRLGSAGDAVRVLGGLPRGRVTPLRHNPARRLVARLDARGERWVLKAHVSPEHGERARRVAAALPADAPVGSLAGVSRDGRLVAHRWVPGALVDATADGQAVAQAVALLRSTPLPPGPAQASLVGLPRLDAPALLAAARRGVAGLAVFDPEVADCARGLLPALGRALARADALAPGGHRVLLHGDLSPDQVVLGPRGPVLLDLDRACVGPAGWDAATWWAAQLAEGSAMPVPLPGHAADPTLLAVAALARVAEPWRRRRAGR
ncbi:MAG TPA: hypothetical protein VK894_12635, partial [Jiangellales bacterium]|nr:hypothetical protein [Jiangellales bacterium]